MVARTAIQDANEGRTQIQKRASTTARVSVSSPGISAERSGLESAIPVVEATTQALETVNNIYQSNAAQSAAMRQGQAEGVNAVDKANKRGKFMSFLFGQDAGYSTAVSIATKNFAQNEYLRQMESVDEFVDMTPEQYQQHIEGTVTKNIEEQFKDDPEAKTIAMDQWATQSRKLARDHTAKHMVYAQQQTLAEGVRDITGQFDDVAMNTRPGSTQEAQEEAAGELATLLSPDFTYVADDGTVASKQASRNIQLTAVEKQLAAGNWAVMKAIPENFTEGMTVTQMNRVDTAMQQYDNAQSREGELIVEEGLLAAASGNEAAMQEAIQKLHLQKNKLSGSATSKEKWTEDKRRLQTSLVQLQKKIAKDSVSEEDGMLYYHARETGDAARQGEFYSKKNEKKADDAVVMVAAGNMATELGIDQPTSISEAIQIAFDHPEVMNSIALRAERYGSISEPFAEAVKARILNIRPDEHGYISSEDLQQIDNLRTLYNKAPSQMRKALGEDASAMIEITLSSSRESVKEIQTKRADYAKNKGLTINKGDLNIPSNMTMEDWIQQQTKTTLDPAALNYYKQQLQRGFRIYGGDSRAARNYMMEQYNGNNMQWRGIDIKNAGMVGYDEDLPSLLEGLEGSGMVQALIETRIPAGSQDQTNPLRGFKDLNDVQMEFNPGTRDLVIRSSQFSYPIVIPETTLSNLSRKAVVGKNKIRVAKEEARLETLKEQGKGGQMWPTPQ